MIAKNKKDFIEQREQHSQAISGLYNAAAPILKCDCSGGEARDLHPCPYREEICANDETLCNCCEYCEQQCVMDI